MIAACVLGGIGVIMLIVRSTRGIAPWALMLACIAGGGAILGFLVVTNVDYGCMERNSDADRSWTPAASAYAAIVGCLMNLIGGLMSCGASKYD